LDTHAIIHRAYHAIPELSSPSGEPVGAVYGLAAMLMRIAKELEPDYLCACYDLPGPTHRHEVYKEYKAKRPKAEDALVSQFALSRKLLAAFGIPLYEAPGFEADDIIGTIAVSAKKELDVIIASGDMDTLQLVDDSRVRVFTLRKGIQDTVLYDEKAVEQRYGFGPSLIPDYKGFAGDPSDNIIGIPGIGEKTATALLLRFGGMEAVYAVLKKTPEKFSSAGFSPRIIELLRTHEDEAEFSKVLATIRTDAPVAFSVPAPFREAIDVSRITAFFTDLGFRSLIPRLSFLTEGERTTTFEKKRSKTEIPETRPLPAADPNDPLFPESAVMLWLTNSELTNPTPEDVLNNTRSKSMAEAHRALREKIETEGLLRVFEEIEKPLIPVIANMNAHGILVDKEYLEALSKEYHAELDMLAKKIHARAGNEFNINSPKQLGDMLFGTLGIGVTGKRRKKTSTGQLSTRESELAKLKDEHPVIEEILSYRALQKLLSTYIDAIPPLLDGNGRLHTTFVQSGTTTGRISSQDPNLQNIPIKTELGRRIRKGFIAPPKYALLAFDYSQIELRLAAVLSGDAKLTAIFARGEDVHTAVAAYMFGIPEREVTEEMRRRAKVINFGILYGMGVNALKENLGTSRSEAQEFYNRYFETFSELSAYLSKTRSFASRTGYTTTLFGRKRYFPGMRSALPYVRAMAERMAINAPLQGSQADMIKLAMVRIHRLFSENPPWDASIVLQIHDELVFEIRKAFVPEAAAAIRGIMEGVISKEEAHGVPILVSGETGPRWGDMEDLS
ncbi:MAG: hypothetical protein JO026_00175, partial [Patescibacteria group bacterium]|nr:hypothetical protein [Patescibacteria group bacterium]